MLGNSRLESFLSSIKISLQKDLEAQYFQDLLNIIFSREDDLSTIRNSTGCKAIVRNIKASMSKLYMYSIGCFIVWLLLEEIGDSRG